MKSGLEDLRPNTPKKIALEAAALGLTAWAVHYKHFRDKDREGSPDTEKLPPGPYPLVESVEEGNVYVYPETDYATVGIYRPDSDPIEIVVKGPIGVDGASLEIESLSTEDVSLLELLRDSLHSATDKLNNILKKQ